MAIYHEMGQPESVAAVKESSVGYNDPRITGSQAALVAGSCDSWIVILHEKKARPLSVAPQATTLLSCSPEGCQDSSRWSETTGKE
jgi:hypothetical protein